MTARSAPDIGGEPIACTLGATDQDARIEEWRQLRCDALLGETREGSVSTTLWKSSAGVLERLGALVAAERRCCSFFDFNLEQEESVIRLRTTYPPGAEAVLDLVFG